MNINNLKAFINKSKTLSSIVKHRQKIVSVYVFLNIAGWFVWNQFANWNSIRWDFVEITFMLHNILMLSLFLIRKSYKAIDKNLWNQFIAIFAFFSGMLFSGQTSTSNAFLNSISEAVILVSYLIGMITLLNLGKSFGVLIANREIKTRGAYAIVRHPMYFTDILFRIGYIISHFNIFTVLLFIVTTACYIYRAILEERFLTLDDDYKYYATKVKYRFIPFIY